MASNENVVFTERLDWMVAKDGERFGPTVVVSVT
jgi:hypothetical protein